MARKPKTGTQSPDVAYPPADPAPTAASSGPSLYEFYTVGQVLATVGGLAVRGLVVPIPMEYLYASAPQATNGGQALYQYSPSGWVLKKAECRPGFAAGPPPAAPGAFHGEIRKVPCIPAAPPGRRGADSGDATDPAGE